MTQKKKKILLVEDDVAITDIYETVMKKAGFDVETADSGQKAIKIIKDIQSGEKIKQDIVLLDLILPDMNGAEVLTQIRGNPLTKDAKVFILTNQEESELQKFGDLKPDKFIIKAHITPTQLVEMIKAQLQ